MRQRTGATRLGQGVLGGAPSPPGHRLSLLELLLPGGQQPLDRLGQAGDLGVDPVDPVQHRLEQGGVLGGEELRALQRGRQLADFGAGAAAGELGQDLRVALAGDQAAHDVPAGHPVQVGEH